MSEGTRRVCSIPGCGKPHSSRGWCKSHYNRWARTGVAPTSPLRWYVVGDDRAALAAKVLQRVDKTESCWLWTGAVGGSGRRRGRSGSSGYGHISLNRRVYKVHRVVYELLVGPIPDGLTLDHLCMVRACCNPAHLEPVTQAENNRRARLAKAGLWPPSVRGCSTAAP